MNKKTKKIKNIIIGCLAFTLLSKYTYTLVKGKYSSDRILLNHQEDKIHTENIVAHRGASALFLDNSYEAVSSALDLDCTDMIEIDIQLTKDNKIVLYHDPVINISNLVIKIEDLNLEEVEDLAIKQYPFYNLSELLYDDTLFLFERYSSKLRSLKIRNELILFEDFLDWYSFSKPLILDIKTSSFNEILMQELNRIVSKYKNFIFIQSDCYEFLVSMMEVYPDYKYLYIIKSKDSLNHLNDKFDGYTVKYSLLEDMVIDEDKLYFVYTINSNQKYFNLLGNKNYNQGMYIITDNPDYICALGESKKLRK